MQWQKKDEIRIQNVELPEKEEKTRWERLEELIELSEEQKKILRDYIFGEMTLVAEDAEKRFVSFDRGVDFSIVMQGIVDIERMSPGLLERDMWDLATARGEWVKNSLIRLVGELKITQRRRKEISLAKWILRHFFGRKTERFHARTAADERLAASIEGMETWWTQKNQVRIPLALFDAYESVLLALEGNPAHTKKSLAKIKNILIACTQNAVLSIEARLSSAALLKLIASEEKHFTDEELETMYKKLEEQRRILTKQPERFNAAGVTAMQILLADRVEADESGIRFMAPKKPATAKKIPPPPTVRNF